MLSKSKTTELRKLLQKKYREETGLFIVEGGKSVDELLRSSLTVKGIWATDTWLSAHPQLSVAAEAVTEVELARISALTTPQQVLAVACAPRYAVADFDTSAGAILLDGIRDPGNLGTIIRTADWFGFRQVVCSTDCVEFTNPKVIQATMGSFARVAVFSADLPAFLRGSTARVFGTFLQGRPIEEVTFRRDDLLVIGNEGRGITEPVARCVTDQVHIPSYGGTGDHAESLNASVAAAVAMYAMRRQML